MDEGKGKVGIKQKTKQRTWGGAKSPLIIPKRKSHLVKEAALCWQGNHSLSLIDTDESSAGAALKAHLNENWAVGVLSHSCETGQLLCQ